MPRAAVSLALGVGLRLVLGLRLGLGVALEIGGIPAAALEPKARRGDQLAQARLAAIRAVLQGAVAHPLDDLQGVAAASTVVLVDGHCEIPSIDSDRWAENKGAGPKNQAPLFPACPRWGIIQGPSQGPLAQSVEHRTFNPLVVRSNRTRPINKNRKIESYVTGAL
jgi:hypothetical protein